MDPRNTRKGKEKNVNKNKNDYKYSNKRVRQYEALLLKETKEKYDKNKK
jgi:hypothetical protein